jgi:hypothetical protein
MEDDFVAAKPPTSTNHNSFQQAARNRFNINQLQATKFNRVQQESVSDLGLGGRPPGSAMRSAEFPAFWGKREGESASPHRVSCPTSPHEPPGRRKTRTQVMIFPSTPLASVTRTVGRVKSERPKGQLIRAEYCLTYYGREKDEDIARC